jgi:hypothetical protein
MPGATAVGRCWRGDGPILGTTCGQVGEKRLAQIRSPEVRRGRPLFAELPKSGTQPSARLPKAEAGEMGLGTQIEP